MKKTLSIISPQLARQWHPTKNGGLTPEKVSAGSKTKVWWKCSNGPDHEWPASIEKRVKRGDGCPCCAGQRVSVTNSLANISPEIAKQWHPTKNGTLTPEQVVAGSSKKAWWKCPKGSDHEWETAIVSRVGGNGCAFCAGQRVSVTNSLASLYPELAQQWHPTKNGSLTPEQVVAGSTKKAWWKCPKGTDHEWDAVIDSRVRGNGCRCCAGQKASVTNSLASLYPELAKQWHPTKNGNLTPEQVVAGSNEKAWWKCPKGLDHEWNASIVNRVGGNGCRFCRGLQSSVTNSLTSLYPEIAKQWHPTKNGKLTPDKIVAGSAKKAWWICPEGADHEWDASIVNRIKGRGCPCCSGQKISVTNCLETRYPEIAKQWHPTKNGTLTPSAVIAGSEEKVWWQCTQDSKHEWEAMISNRVHGRRCPFCNSGWTVEKIRHFISTLINHLETFTAAELYLLFQQSGMLQSTGKGKSFVKALATGRFPKEEIKNFINGESSIVDQFLQDKQLTLESLETNINNDITDERDITSDDNLDNQINQTIEPSQEEDNLNFPIVQTREVLSSLDHHVVSSADEEAVEFLIASAKAKIWKHVFHEETTALAQAEEYTGDTYSDRVKTEFLDEYHRAKNLEIPTGYAFRIDGKLAEPNLMQRLIAVRVRDQKRVGNWSGTGAGKTLSAVLASRVINAHLTLICCPNSVVEGWKNAILKIFPDSVVITKTFNPNWAKAIGNETDLGALLNPEIHHYLILNYEMFQQPDSAKWIRSFIENESIDFIVIDEIHYTKQRQIENMSRRKELVTALLTTTAERNPNLHVIGMSATPVINNIQEGKSLIEMVTGFAHNELDIHPTIANCMRLHQRLVTLGIRWMPEYKLDYEQIEIPVDCGEYIEEIRALGGNGTPLQLEKILTVARLPVIRKHIQPKTLIYTHYIQGIDRILRDALVNDGWKVGFYTGEDKSGLEGFLNGKIDVLIGSSAIGTGVDGLQHVCNQLIVNVLPWTHAEFEQLKGRIYRQGQTRDTVKMVIPLTYATVNSQRWSWCDSKMQRLKFKKSIADAAVDGIVPEGHLRSSAQAYQDAIGWLERLASGEVQIITRPKIIIPIPDTNPAEVQQRLARYGDFSTMNRHWNQTHSATTHQRLQENPEEWAHYHTLYQESRKDWAVIPYEEMIRWCQQRSGYTIGDFGCGEAKLAEAVSDRHTVYSFDHIAINDNAIACDMAHVPLDDETLDVAIFSLSLMGSNFSDYLREAYRTLKLDGQLHIIEPTSRFSDPGQFRTDLEVLGFTVISIQDMWKFTHIRAIKS
ncbi:zinc-ribbon domain-containing protein [Microcoleus sp. S13_C5]|uniref:zinc-ribbon domain-containing protein n=1 Tax=Microcoleus sp. S13_C5 TaxID=3055411 RepID=UPI002FD6CB1D